MKNSEIGTNAGIVWQLVDKNGAMNIANIKKKTKLDSESLYMALGWLARENKIIIDKIDDKLIITLIY